MNELEASLTGATIKHSDSGMKKIQICYKNLKWKTLMQI